MKKYKVLKMKKLIEMNNSFLSNKFYQRVIFSYKKFRTHKNF
jgi:hypothetical protein